MISRYLRLRTNLKCIGAPIKLVKDQRNAHEATDGLTIKVIKFLAKLLVGRFLRNQEEEHMVDFLDSGCDSIAVVIC